jgi:CBS domain-containing protein
MARRPRLPSAPLLRRHRAQRSERLLAHRLVQQSLVSVAGLVGTPVLLPTGAEVGHLTDVVVRWETTASYPPVTGVVVRVGRRLAFVPVEQIDTLTHGGVRLRSARLDLADFERRDGEVVLMGDVVDHQLVDVDGVRVIRAADLYLASIVDTLRLVGVDVGVTTLLRRLGPTRWRGRPTPDRVIDWAAIQPFGRPGSPLRLREGNRGLHLLQPAELADLLEELGRSQRQELLAALEPEAAADALEEMEPKELESLLREAPTEQAAALLAVMEPDEAVDALRDLEADDRDQLLAAMPEPTAQRLAHLLEYPERTAGGIMNANVVAVPASCTVSQVRRILQEEAGHRDDIDAVAAVDEDGRLVADVTLFELFLAGEEATLESFLPDAWPATVEVDTPLDDVVQRFIENRHSSVIVVDADEQPLGRILADDVVDALVPERGRRFGGILA